MIDVTKLTEADKGRRVKFTNYCNLPYVDEGRIKSWDKCNVFVVFRCNGDWENYAEYTAEAVHKTWLEFVEEGEC